MTLILSSHSGRRQRSQVTHRSAFTLGLAALGGSHGQGDRHLRVRRHLDYNHVAGRQEYRRLIMGRQDQVGRTVDNYKLRLVARGFRRTSKC